jgi:WD40 repeat protein
MSFRQFVNVFALLMLIFVSHPSNNSIAQAPLPAEGRTIIWHPNGTEFALVATNGIFIYNRELDLLRYSLISGAYGGHWSLDGSKIIIGKRVLDATSLQIILEYTGEILTWLDDGIHLVRAYYPSADIALDGEIQIIRAETDVIIKRIPVPFRFDGFIVSPDYTKFVVFVAGTLMLYDVELESEIVRYQIDDYIQAVQWFDDNRRILILSSNVIIFDTVGYRILQSLNPLTETLVNLRIHPNQKQFIASGSRLDTFYVSDIGMTNIINTIPTQYPIAYYSPYGGVVATILVPDQAPIQLNPNQVIVSSPFVQLLVPDNSPNQINELIAQCQLEMSLTPLNPSPSLIEIDTLINSVQQNATLTLGCRVDLLAVAQSLRAETAIALTFTTLR